MVHQLRTSFLIMALRIADCGLRVGLRIRARAGLRTLAAAIVVAVAASSARAETIDRVLAVAGGNLIMLTDVTAARDLQLQTADGAADRRNAMVEEFMAGLRRRGDVIDLYLPGR